MRDKRTPKDVSAEAIRKAVEMCLRMLKESNKSRFDRYSRQKQCIKHIPYYLSGLSCAHFSDNLSRNSCTRTLLKIDSRPWKPYPVQWHISA